MSFEIGSDAFIKESIGTSSVLPITEELPGIRQELLQPWKCEMLDENPVSSPFQHSVGISAHRCSWTLHGNGQGGWNRSEAPGEDGMGRNGMGMS